MFDLIENELKAVKKCTMDFEERLIRSGRELVQPKTYKQSRQRWKTNQEIDMTESGV